MDTIIKLKHPPQYEPADGAKFDVHFEKSRGFYGDDAKSISVSLDSKTGTWSFQDLSETTFDLVVELHRDGLKPIEITNELEVNRSTVSRHLKKARTQGLIQ